MTLRRISQTHGDLSRALIFTAVALAFAIQAPAAPAGGGLPWEAPMTAIAASLTGPVAYAIGLIGIAIAGGTMLWGGDLGEVGRKACMVGLVIAVLVFAAPMLSTAFGVAAALV
jgi:type IV secretory pathway VirB2 component (pilin)